MSTVVVTGGGGFLGRNLRETLGSTPECHVYSCESTTLPADRAAMLQDAEVVFHLAGVNRPASDAGFHEGNVEATRRLLEEVGRRKEPPKIIFASSIQATGTSAYGHSKRMAEDLLEAFAKNTGAEVVAYRLKNIFGKWSRPHYNSVVATFCHQLARGLPMDVADPARPLELVYVDDVVREFVGEITPRQPGYRLAAEMAGHHTTLGELADLVAGFAESRRSLVMPDLRDAFAKSLYATFLSFLPQEAFAYQLEQRHDARGDLAEFFKSPHAGQIFVSRTRPGVTRGNHYHHTKAEKFLVISGEGVIRLREVDREHVLEYRVSGDRLRVVDIPPGYTHAIENVGAGDMTVLFWASEMFDPQRPDTHVREVA